MIFSRWILNIPNLKSFLRDYKLCLSTENIDVIGGWGYRPYSHKAQKYARKNNIPYIALEDGFLRSVGLGVEGWPPFSMVVDDLGIYYDTSKTSRLEQLILDIDKISPETLCDAQKAMELIVKYALSKYNHAPDFSWGLLVPPSHSIREFNSQDKQPIKQSEIVLVIDQTFGDMAVKYGSADHSNFSQMLHSAIEENPTAEIWVKTHPDVLSGKKKGYLTNLSNYAERVRLFTQDVNPLSLLAVVNKVYCVTSQMGFEALLLGKPVVTFGVPWFAGWGLTDDRHGDVQQLLQSPRRVNRSLLQLFTAAYLQYSRYINPNTGKSGTIFDVIDYLAAARVFNEKLRGNLYCVGVSWWKRAVLKPFFKVPACRLHFVSSLQKLQSLTLQSDAKLLVWGCGKQQWLDFAAERELPVLHMEDGFIRSVGLGSNLVPPLSLVCDDMGIYFNAEKPSRLEYILQNSEFSEQDTQTASWLQKALTEAGISKYNVGSKHALEIPTTASRILLVPGQVEDDASIRYGSPQIRMNLDLLRTVRQRNPDAYIIYKPHPDVVSGNRIGKVAPEEIARYADQIVTACDISICLQYAQEVHTMTSLTGFEALLRGKKVYCYGLPFYAGWGLTNDYLSISRRTRKLTLLQLIAGTLIHYPTYISPENYHFIDVSTAVEILRKQKTQLQNGESLHRSFVSKQWSKLKQLRILFK